MPVYDYACTACGRRVEVIHGRDARGPERCDVCGGRMERLISSPAVHFKGSGWAKKDAHAKAASRAKRDEGGAPAIEGSDRADGAAKKPSEAPEKGDRAEPSQAPEKGDGPKRQDASGRRDHGKTASGTAPESARRSGGEASGDGDGA